jgi:threonine dehydratase
VIAGQGTIGLEILHQLPEVGSVVVPLSGGGLIAGIALALKSANPAIRAVGVSMAAAPAKRPRSRESSF